MVSDGGQPPSPTYFVLMGRALRLCCPRCGQGPLFQSAFRMHARCGQCGLDFQREPGFYLGSVYVNYGITAILASAAFIGLNLVQALRPPLLLALCILFCAGFGCWFFRYARSLWLAFDQYWDPQPPRSP